MQTEVLEPKELTPATLYPEVHKELAKLAEENDKAVFDYEDAKQNKLARSHVYSLRGYKSSVEKRRKELKVDALAYGRKVDGAAKEITTQIEDMIAVHQEPLDRIEQREKDRGAAIQKAINGITDPADLINHNSDSAHVQEMIERVEAISITPEVYQERMADATTLKADTIKVLTTTRDKFKEQEAEAAELARLRAEAEERERKDREDKIAREAAAEAQRKAEEKANAERAEAERREREAIERAERAEQEAKDAAAKAEADRIAAEQEAEAARQKAVHDAEVAAERKAVAAEHERERQAEAQRVANEKRASDRKHIEKVKREAIAGVEDAIGIGDDDANRLIDAIMAGLVPHVSIRF